MGSATQAFCLGCDVARLQRAECPPPCFFVQAVSRSKGSPTGSNIVGGCIKRPCQSVKSTALRSFALHFWSKLVDAWRAKLR